MWPWQARSQDLSRILLSRSGSHAAPPQHTTEEVPPGGGLMLQAPFGDADRPDYGINAIQGDYHVSIGPTFALTPEMLDAAILDVKRLEVTFEEGLRETSCIMWIFRLANLTGLCMNRYPFRTLPDEIGNLKKLEHLHMYGSALIRVPRTIGCLKELRELDLYTSYSLHYLPIEVLACTQLVESRFSTRALFHNKKCTMGLPDLSPWQPGELYAPGFEYLLAILREGVELEVSLARSVLSFLPWNHCSLCGRVYMHDLGSYAWSHQTVGTDRQSLLAFCCSLGCAGRVTHQVKCDTFRGCMLKLKDGSWQEQGQMLPVPRNAFDGGHLAPWSGLHLNQDASCRFQPVPRSARAELHSKQYELLHSLKTELASTLSMPAKRLQVVATGDVRSSPGGHELWRLAVDDIVSATQNHVDGDGRIWVYVTREGSMTQAGWTAMAKKSGKLKLRAI